VPSIPTSPLGTLLPRHASAVADEALGDTRVVHVAGARQCGKSTLAAQIGNARSAKWRSLDRAVIREAARFDPEGFVASDGLMVIDEVQRVPELLLAIKESVDSTPIPGRFLLTGSARLLGLRGVPDALPGRMETIELWPLSQGEIDRSADGFVDALYAAGANFRHATAESRDGYIERIIRGGFPEAVARPARRRERFLDNYVADIINRDVMQISEIEKGPLMLAMARMLAARSGQLLVPAVVAKELGLPQPTVTRYLTLLEEVFLIKRLPSWSRRIGGRSVGTPKVAMVDSGVAAALSGLDTHALRQPGRNFGGLLEAFVAMEIARQLTWSQQRAELFHYRTKDKVEVDLVVENRAGQVLAFDVKASSTVRAEDFRGLRHLADRIGEDLIVGAVLYTGQETLPFGPRFRAIPISAVWEAGS
jgi:uncharacterized protein